MLDYLLNPAYRKAKDAYDQEKKKKDNLEKYKKDLTDDSGAINRINSSLNDVIDDFKKMIPEGGVRTRVATKIEALHEPNQTCDTYLSEAERALQDEINCIKKKMKKAEAAMTNAKNNCGCNDGGGGSW